MTVLLTDTTGLTGLLAGCFLEQARGFTAPTASTDMWITGLIRITATLDRCRSAGRSASTTSMEMRREMGAATWATPTMKAGLSTRSPDITAVAMLVDMAAGTTRAQLVFTRVALRDSV